MIEMSVYTRTTVERAVAHLWGPRAGEIRALLDRYPSEQSIPPFAIDLDALSLQLGRIASSKERERAANEALRTAFRQAFHTPAFDEFRCRVQLTVLKLAGADADAIARLVTTACGGYGFRNVLGPADDHAQLEAWLRAVGAVD
jgi:hypothetical protein